MPNYCPRCIEPYEDESKPSSGGNLVAGTKVKSDCKDCGVCKNCEHLLMCVELMTEAEKRMRYQYLNK